MREQRQLHVLQTSWPEEDYNGIALGGPQMGFHGLFLDRFLEGGHSRGTPHCDTFDSPCLAGSAEFTIDTVEAWQAGESVEDMLAVVAADGAAKVSVLANQDAAADKEILKHAGRTFHSDNL